jgi:hypothetical protein
LRGKSGESWQQRCLHCLKEKQWNARKNDGIAEAGDKFWRRIMTKDVNGDWSCIY